MGKHASHVRPVDLTLAQRAHDCICGKCLSDGETCVWCGHGVIEPPKRVRQRVRRERKRGRRGSR